MAGWGRWFARRWHESLYRQAIVAMWGAAPQLTALLLASVGLVVAGVVAQVLAVGSLIGDLPEAVRQGTSSGAAGRVEDALVVVGCALLVQMSGTSLAQALAPSLGRQMEEIVRRRAMTAALAPHGVLHLQDPEVADVLTEASSLRTVSWGPSMAPRAMVPLLISLLTGMAMACIVGTYRWWLGLALAAAWLFARDTRRREGLDQWKPWFGGTSGPRRQAYFRQLAMTPAAAKELRIFGLGGWVVDSFHRSWSANLDARRRSARRDGRRMLLVAAALVVANVGALAVIADGAHRGVVGIASLTVLVQAAIRTGVTAEPGSINWDVIFPMSMSSLVAVEQLERRLVPLAVPREPGESGGWSAPRDAIRFEGVSFRYPDRESDTLHGLDLTLRAGRSLAIVGENGVGKTTLVKVLCGLLQPSDGSVTVDGRPLTALDPHAWRAQLAVVFQEFAHFPVSARDNVSFGAPGVPVTDAELDAVAAKSGLSEVIDDLVDGWSTPLSREVTGGSDLSGGQWQRVALARALLAVKHGASVLILDEPTANLDVRSEAAFYDRFLDLTAGLTTIVISHRFATVRRADAIAVLTGDGVAELGSHDELVALDGTYARLFRLQAEHFAEDDLTLGLPDA